MHFHIAYLGGSVGNARQAQLAKLLEHPADDGLQAVSRGLQQALLQCAHSPAQGCWQPDLLNYTAMRMVLAAVLLQLAACPPART